LGGKMTDIDTLESIRLMLAYLCIKDKEQEPLKLKVEVLDRFGLPDTLIAQVCNVKDQSVRNARLELKTKK
jgi:hypothetical protein